MKKIHLLLFLALLLPFLSYAACPEETLVQKETIQLRLRLDLLKYQEKQDDFVEKMRASLNGKTWQSYRAKVMDGPGDAASRRETLCRLVDRFVVMADDMLAGGDGTGTRKPWHRYTPEEVLAKKQEFDRLCEAEYKADCGSDRIGLTAMEFIAVESALETGKITPGDYIDQGYALYTKLLDILKGQNTP